MSKPGRRPEQPSPEGTAFRKLSAGLQTKTLVALLGVSREMISRYRYHGAPEDKLMLLRDYLTKRAHCPQDTAIPFSGNP